MIPSAQTLALLLSLLVLAGCSASPSPPSGQVADPPTTITMGRQTWATQNLNVTTFRNGDPIPEAKSAEEWREYALLGQPAWCYSLQEPALGKESGRLYNGYAIFDPRGLAPQGWHIPTDAEWNVLSAHEDSLWTEVKQNGKGLPADTLPFWYGGFRTQLGDFSSTSTSTTWWSATLKGENTVWTRSRIFQMGGHFHRHDYSMANGFSVRLVAD